MAESVQELVQHIQQPGRVRTVALIFSLGWLVLIAGLWWVDPLLALAGMGGTMIFVLFGAYPMLPLYLMAFFYPFLHWEFVYSNLNAPIVDVIGLCALGAWLIRIFWKALLYPQELKKLRFPGIGIFAAFIVVALYSASQAWDVQMSLKFVLRPLLFFYAVYILYIVNTLKSKKQLHTVLATMYAVGILIAVYGVYSFFTVNVPTFLDRRVIPVDIFGKNPLGANHNLVADVMVTTIPIGFYLMMSAKRIAVQKLYFIGIALMAGVNLLTFSRTGWIVLLLELILLGFFEYRHHAKTILKYSVGTLVIASPLILGLVFFFGQDSFQSSNENRLVLNDIAWEAFTDRPVHGTGPGTFTSVVDAYPLYLEMFGEALDAHGFIQKVGSELGALGLISFVMLLLYIIYRIWNSFRQKHDDDEWSFLLIAVLLMAVGGIVFQLFQTSYFVSKMWLPLGVGLAAATIALNKKKHG